MSSKQEMKKSN